MKGFIIFMFIIVFGIFAGVFYLVQGNSLLNSHNITLNQIPTLPPDAGTFKLLSSLSQQPAQPNQRTQGEVAPTFGVEDGVKASYSAVIKTTKGDITLILFGQYAPNTVKNFITKAEKGFYKGLTIHRVEDWVIQGGDPKGDGTGGGLMRTELNDIPFVTGSLGVARAGNINTSNDSQFFITKSEANWLNQQYTNFGEITNGMEVVNNIKAGDKILGIKVIE